MKSSLLPAAVAISGLLLPSTLFAVTATGLSSFEGVEEPSVRFASASKAFADDDFVNITDLGEGTFRMRLRYRSEEWDGDRDTLNNDRQRAEVKGLGPHQKDGDSFEYGMSWRTNPSFQGSSRFCHIFQLKATDGDSGAPLVTLSIQSGSDRASVQYWSGPAKSSSTVRKFAWKPGVWQAVRIRIKTSTTKAGEVLASIEGDEFQGVRGVEVYREDATGYRPKWGLYRGASAGMRMGDDYIEHRDVFAERVGAFSDPAALKLESAARERAQGEPLKALTWLQQQPPSAAGRALAIATIAALWAEKEPANAMSWAEKLPASEERADAIQRIFNRWSDQDVDSASRWLKTQKPTPELDPLLWFFITDTTYRYVDRTKVLDCVSLVADSGLRARAIEHVVLIWARKEPALAARYIEELSVISPGQKTAILKKFPARKS
jgi:hypothetical protein